MLLEVRSHRLAAGLPVLAALALLAALAIYLTPGTAEAAQPWKGWTWIGPEGGSFSGATRVAGSEGTYFAWSYDAGVFTSTDAGRTWRPINRNLVREDSDQSRVPELVVSPGGTRQYVADYYLWTRTSGAWSRLSVPEPARVVRLDPGDADTLWIGTTGGIFRSTDGGASWTKRSTGLGPTGSPQVRYLDVGPEGTLYATILDYRGDVARSTDGGASWARTSVVSSGNPSLSCLVADPSRPGTVYACIDRYGLYRSRDGGHSWQLAMPDSLRSRLGGYTVAVAEAAPEIVWYAGQGGLYRSTDGGEGWELIDLGTGFRETRGVALSADGRTVLAATRLGLLRSTDGGDTWGEVERGLRASDARRVVASPDRPEQLFAMDGRLARSRDGGATWERNVPPGGLLSYPLLYTPGPVPSPADPDRVWLAAPAGLYRSDDAGATWERLPDGVASFTDLLLPHLTDRDTLVASSRTQGLYLSRDGGETWSRAWALDRAELTSFYVRAGRSDPTDPDVFYVLADRYGPNPSVHETLLRSTDGGASFQIIREPTGFAAMAVAADGTIYLADRGPDDRYRLTFSHTRGGTWIPAGPLPVDEWPADLEADPADPDHLIVAYTFSSAPRETTNGGLTWHLLDLTGLPDPWPHVNDVYWRGDDDPRLYLATSGGIYARGADDCSPDASGALCLGGGRYEVRTRWTTPFGTSGSGHGLPLTADTGYFWFFRPANVEMLVKVLDACALADRTWTFAGGLTNVAVELEVLDRRTGARRLYENPQQTPFAPVQDTAAFLSCDAAHPFGPTAAPPEPPPTPDSSPSLALSGGRFVVQVTWTTEEGGTGAASAVPLSDDTGYFWFFRDSNVEMVVKLLDGCAVNGRYWVFAGGLTNVGTHLVVTDTATGTSYEYDSEAGPAFAPLQDTTTLDACP